MRLPYEERVAYQLRNSTQALTKLRSTQRCFLCEKAIAKGEFAAWSARRARWRHADCQVPLPASAG